MSDRMDYNERVARIIFAAKMWNGLFIWWFSNDNSVTNTKTLVCTYSYSNYRPHSHRCIMTLGSKRYCGWQQRRGGRWECLHSLALPLSWLPPPIWSNTQIFSLFDIQGGICDTSASSPKLLDHIFEQLTPQCWASYSGTMISYSLRIT